MGTDVATTPRPRVGVQFSYVLAAYVVAMVAAMFPLFPVQPGWAATHLLAGLSLCAGGFALWVTGRKRSGLWLGAASVLWLLARVDAYDAGPLPVIAYLLAPLHLVPLAIVILTYPKGRLTDGPTRAWALTATAVMVLGRSIEIVLRDPTWSHPADTSWWPTLVHREGLHAVVEKVVYLLFALLVVSFVVLLVRRMRRLAGRDRSEYVPVVIAGCLLSFVLVTDLISRIIGITGRLWEAVVLVEQLAIMFLPVGFIVAALQHSMARGAVAELVLSIGRADTPDDVERGLRTALGDPTLDVVELGPDADSLPYRRVEDPGPDDWAVTDGRAVAALCDRHGRPLALVSASASVTERPVLLSGALAAAGLALENSQLHAAARQQLEDAKDSRQRIVEAGLRERRQVERDLHDGAQQRLLALGLTLGRLQPLTDPELRPLVEHARTELRVALEELRDLARGILPAVLTQSGLAAALDALFERCPVRVESELPTRSWSTAVETTAYFVVSEALTNVVKHAGANVAHVRVSGTDELLVVVVEDDGNGGAVERGGGGLAGLRDRVDALYGSLTVSGSPLGGSRVEARLPCG